MEIGAAKDEAEAKEVLDKGYMSVIGSLLYATAMTRPDVSFHIIYNGFFCVTPPLGP